MPAADASGRQIVTKRLDGPNRGIRTRVVGIPIIWVAHERLAAAANRHELAKIRS